MHRKSLVAPFSHQPVCLALLFALGISPAAWAVVDEPVRAAIEAVDAKQAQRAYDLLLPLEASRAGDPDFDTAFGIAANQIGESARAIFALERVLIVQPNNARAKAELARALFAVGDTAQAKKLLEETKALGVPEDVGLTIDGFLQVITSAEAAGRPSVKGYVDASLGYDSNANSGPSSNSFIVPALGGGLVNLLPEGRKTDGAYLQLSGNLTGRTSFAPRWSAYGTANASLRDYKGDASKFDLDQVDLSGGISYRQERNELFGTLNIGQTALSGTTLRRLSGVTFEWIYRPTGKNQWGSFLQLTDLNYPTQSVRDAKRSVLGTSYTMQSAGGNVYFASVYFGREKQDDARFPHLGQHLTGVRLGTQIPIGSQWSINANAVVENRSFGGTDPLFLVVRKDTQFDLSLGATYRLSESWRFTPQMNYSRTRSNIVVNDNSKNSVNISARREF